MSKLQAMGNVFIAILCKPFSSKFASCEQAYISFEWEIKTVVLPFTLRNWHGNETLKTSQNLRLNAVSLKNVEIFLMLTRLHNPVWKVWQMHTREFLLRSGLHT